MTHPNGATDRVVLVAIKHVPVGGTGLRVDGDRLTRDGLAHGLDPIDEVALEWSLRSREAGSADRVVAATIGPSEALESLRKALAMGANEAVLVSDEEFAGADVRTTARALAAVTRRLHADLLVLGVESADGSSGAVPGAVAAVLDWPLISRMADGRLDSSTVEASRDLGAGPESVLADLPAVISMIEGNVEPRYPKLRDVLRSKSARATVLTSADLDVTVATSVHGEARLVATPPADKHRRVVGLDEGVDELFQLLTAGSDHD